MNRFMLVQIGFVMPTPEIMEEWGKWFESIAGRNPENFGPSGGGREITKSGTQELPMGLDSITGFSIIDAESMDDAESVAKACPFITGVRVYELRGH